VTEAVQDGRIFIELVNGAFLEADGTRTSRLPARLRWVGCRARKRDVCEVHACRCEMFA